MISVLDNTAGAAKDIVCLNAGASIYVAGLAEDYAAGIRKDLEDLEKRAWTDTNNGFTNVKEELVLVRESLTKTKELYDKNKKNRKNTRKIQENTKKYKKIRKLKFVQSPNQLLESISSLNIRKLEFSEVSLAQ